MLTRLALVLLVLGPGTTFATTVTVGSGPGCGFSSLAAALAALNNDPDPQPTIRVQSGIHAAVNATVNRSVVIEGAYDGCTDGAPNPQLRSILDAGGSGRVITVQGSSSGTPIDVRLSNLSLERGRATKGGGLSIQLGARVTLDNSLVLNNEATDGGGGISFEGTSAARLELLRSGVNGNRAPTGGGIFCEGPGVLEIRENSGIVGNEAVSLGGGVRAGVGCRVDLLGPVSVNLNRAGHGGGLFIGEGSTATLEGGAHGLVAISRNQARAGGIAGGTGGGIAVDGTGSRLSASGVVLSRNRALHADGSGGSGGGLSVDSNSRAFLRLESVGCPGGLSCTRIEGNEARVGAALRVGHRGFAEIENVEIVDNQGTSSIVEVGAPVGTNPATLDLSSSYFHRNIAPQLVHGSGNATMRLAHLTVAEHPLVGPVVRTSTHDQRSPTVTLLNSVLQHHAPVFDVAEATVTTAGCLFVENASGLSTFPDIFLEDPELVDPVGGDLHLAPGSPAIDRCDAPGFGAVADSDGDSRFPDASPIAGLGGRTFDAGADEVGAGLAIFTDGFESGDTSSWSSTQGAI